ncbi:MAG: hypothetical protein OXG24_01405 [Gammaproteobacteria bacterium]|nr:hypothetical protein [Gammaproteobacteria bacterium]
MNETVVQPKKRVVRSKLELDQLCNVFWLSSLGCVMVIHSETLAIEGHLVAVNVLIALAVLAISYGVMKMCQSLGHAMMKRSKRVEFIDDIKNSSLYQERLPAIGIYGFPNLQDWKLTWGIGNLLLMLTLYVVVVLLSFGYRNSLFFYVALAISVCIVASAIFLFAKEMGSGKSRAKENGSSSLQDTDESSTLPESLDSQISWIVKGEENAQFRFSRNWIGEHLLRIGIWVPLLLAIPLIGPFFGESFWLAMGIGVVFLILLEMCSVFIFSKACSRILRHQ